MDKKNKIVILVLIILAVLFFSGVGGNLVSKQRGSTDSKDDYVSGDKGWEETLGEWMAPFAPSLDVDKLFRINSGSCKSGIFQHKYKVIILNKIKDSCIINIPGFSDEKYKKGTLRLAEEQAIVPDVTIQFVPGGEKSADYKPVSFRDELQDGKNKKMEKSFVVLSKGGTLKVECKGCFENQDRAIHVIFE